MAIKNLLPIALLALVHFSPVAMAQGAACAPGGTFDLSKWKLQLPTGKARSPDEVSASELKGCNGYKSEYFFTSPDDGSLVMKVPGSTSTTDCVTTPNSKHCRTELRENSPSKWSPSASKNRLFGDLLVRQITDDRVVVGQIHIDGSISTKPVCELYYSSKGDLTMGVNRCRTCGQDTFTVGHVPVGQRFTYEIRYEKGILSVSLNGQAFQKLDNFDLDSPDSYFKAGNYNQGNGPTEVHFFAIRVSH
ncbi:hypothetical protein CNMCM8980_005212 [Aspergillus fumigatiaffinis]|uniref:Alginate lyase 2 domain-containing protein n=1 Tax=Aspergillus fumigatiaffinis TaxID=340414 RepID=A0A8H4H556_9EURO|nr:hypothetical protein CNMCM6805_004773 [Aspergillus fumigatiaffinis]KAF4231650.1 hypothetical protein CNMCM8980_005212 [Aspergillus fumigatiaffinis]KAF4236010.1 hypothetical protein CNMCM6457_002617 [Aspergillus fumigatiaffinis]